MVDVLIAGVIVLASLQMLDAAPVMKTDKGHVLRRLLKGNNLAKKEFVPPAVQPASAVRETDTGNDDKLATHVGSNAEKELSGLGHNNNYEEINGVDNDKLESDVKSVVEDDIIDDESLLEILVLLEELFDDVTRKDMGAAVNAARPDVLPRSHGRVTGKNPARKEGAVINSKDITTLASVVKQAKPGDK